LQPGGDALSLDCEVRTPPCCKPRAPSRLHNVPLPALTRESARESSPKFTLSNKMRGRPRGGGWVGRGFSGSAASGRARREFPVLPGRGPGGLGLEVGGGTGAGGGGPAGRAPGRCVNADKGVQTQQGVRRRQPRPPRAGGWERLPGPVLLPARGGHAAMGVACMRCEEGLPLLHAGGVGGTVPVAGRAGRRTGAARRNSRTEAGEGGAPRWVWARPAWQQHDSQKVEPRPGVGRWSRGIGGRGWGAAAHRRRRLRLSARRAMGETRGVQPWGRLRPACRQGCWSTAAVVVGGQSPLKGVQRARGGAQSPQ
jgi:hypothetical protein